MREILFRAKRKNWRELSGEEWWVKGYPVIYPSGKAEIYEKCIEPPDILKITEIDPGTLCQYTGLEDKSGKRIWENDIVKHDASDTIGTVKWFKEDYIGWCVDDVQINEQQFTGEMWNECEIIGNIFDNSELL